MRNITLTNPFIGVHDIGLNPSLDELCKRAQKTGLYMTGSRSWRYLNALTNRRGQAVIFCWSVGKNTAGYYLSWREVHAKNGSMVRRDQWTARRLKWKCAEIAKTRRDAHDAKMRDMKK